MYVYVHSLCVQSRVMGATFDKPWGINNEIRKLRSKGLNCEDECAKNRLSHKNESIKKLYADYLGQPGGEKIASFVAHKI